MDERGKKDGLADRTDRQTLHWRLPELKGGKKERKKEVQTDRRK